MFAYSSHSTNSFNQLHHMKHYYSSLLLFFAGFMLASASGGVQKRSLGINAQTKIAKIDNVIKGLPAKAPTAPAATAADEEWTLVGTGKYTDDIMTNTGVNSATWDVEIYESVSTPGFYRVENPYGNGNCPYFDAPFECCDFLLHAEDPENVWMEYVELKNIDFGLTAPDVYCPAYTGDYVGYYVGAGFFDVETAIAMGMCTGKMLGGNITFEPESLILDFPLFEDEGFTVAANVEGLFCVSLPGASDFKFSIESTDICTTDNLSIAYNAGADIQEVKYDIFPGMLSFEGTDDDLFISVKNEGQVAKGGSVTVAPQFGINTVAFVAISSEDEIVGKQIFYCFGQQENAEEWTSIGKAEYSEDLLSSIYPDDLNNVIYEVDIEESVTTPGRYRLIDLYGPAYPYYQDLVNDDNILIHDHHHYVVVDATNPEMVYIEAAPMGTEFGYGQTMLFSEGWFFMQQGADLTDPEVLEGFGKLEDGKITFLGGAIFMYMPQFGMPRGNINHKFYIKLPASGSIASVKTDSDEQAPVYYNLSGIKVSSTTTPGIYFKVTGNKTEKLIVK